MYFNREVELQLLSPVYPFRQSILFPFRLVYILTGSTTHFKVLKPNDSNTSNSDGILHISIINCITFLIYIQEVFPTVQRIEMYMYIIKILQSDTLFKKLFNSYTLIYSLHAYTSIEKRSVT